jgi:hypothetical protein
VTLRSVKDVIFALGAPALNAKEHNSIDAHKARNALCFMRIPFYEDLKRHVLLVVKFEPANLKRPSDLNSLLNLAKFTYLRLHFENAKFGLVYLRPIF